jgi:hypothetical protein
MTKESEHLFDLVKQNGIPEEFFATFVRDVLIQGLFGDICKDIRLQRRYADERIRFMQSSNKVSAAKSIIRRYSGCQLDDSDYEYLGNLFICFFNRSDRKRPDLSQKSDLLEKQQFKCNICGKPINTSDELDHIVPYDFVGDELPDNAQMLCKTCNTRKGNSTGYGLVVLLKQGNKSG